MKKTGSSGNIFYNEKTHYINNSLRPLTTTKPNKFRRNTNFLKNNLIFIENDSYTSNYYNLEHILLNKSPKQLYEGLMSLKKRVNYLNEEISLAKSAQRKKDVQLNLKNKEIEGYISDIKMSKDLNPINIDKLKEINVITKLKKEYNLLKKNLDELKNKKNILEIKLKKSRPNKVKQANLILEKRLKNLIIEYDILHQNNEAINKQLEEMKNLPKIFAENHKIIENLKNRIDNQEETVTYLKEQINEVNNKRYFNEIILDRQKIKNINLNQKNLFLENEIQNRKKIAEMKTNYENKIQKLNEKKIELEEKLRNQERTINSIKYEIKLSEDMKKADKNKLKIFNYTSISKLESNPKDKMDSKFMLLQSLLNESLNKKKKYQNSIQACISKFKELGYDYSELDKILEENKNNTKDNKENEDNKEKDEINDINDNNKEKLDNKSNNSINKDKIINENINNDKEKKEENDKKQDDDSNQHIFNQNVNIEENNKSKNDEDKYSYNKELNELNNNNNEIKKDSKDLNNNISDKEKNNAENKINNQEEEKKSEKEISKLSEINTKNKINELDNSNTKFSNISIKDKKEQKVPITDDEFSEFIFILLIN